MYHDVRLFALVTTVVCASPIAWNGSLVATAQQPAEPVRAERVGEPTSAAVVVGTVPYDTLRLLAERESAKFAGQRSDRAEVAKLRVAIPLPWGGESVLFEQTVHADWTIEWRPSGPPTLRPEGGRLFAALPIRFRGQGGLSGDLARRFGLHRKDFEGEVEIRLTTGLRLDEEFCPRLVDPQPDVHWLRNASLELVGRNCDFWVQKVCVGPWNLDVKGQVDGPLRQALQSAVARSRRDRTSLRAGTCGTHSSSFGARSATRLRSTTRRASMSTSFRRSSAPIFVWTERASSSSPASKPSSGAPPPRARSTPSSPGYPPTRP